MVSRIYLTGPRACGKTTIGKALAQTLGWTFTDTDALIVKNSGAEIADIVGQLGWDAFRDRETEALKECAQQTNMVIATGGGMVLRDENRHCMRETGCVIRLDVPLKELARRLEEDLNESQRPSLTGRSVLVELADVLRERDHLYRDAAHHTVDATGTIEEITQNIIKLLDTCG